MYKMYIKITYKEEGESLTYQTLEDPDYKSILGEFLEGKGKTVRET